MAARPVVTARGVPATGRTSEDLDGDTVSTIVSGAQVFLRHLLEVVFVATRAFFIRVVVAGTIAISRMGRRRSAARLVRARGFLVTGTSRRSGNHLLWLGPVPFSFRYWGAPATG